MAELNTQVENLVAYWGKVNVDIKDLEERLGKEVYEQLDSYIYEVESCNDEIDVDTIISDMEEAQYQLEAMQSEVESAVDALANAISNAEDLR
tara:strand:+ start:326 stop:604 length:279 start_codon:yes stop_codon:yes gene_type:complete